MGSLIMLMAAIFASTSADAGGSKIEERSQIIDKKYLGQNSGCLQLPETPGTVHAYTVEAYGLFEVHRRHYLVKVTDRPIIGEKETIVENSMIEKVSRETLVIPGTRYYMQSDLYKERLMPQCLAGLNVFITNEKLKSE